MVSEKYLYALRRSLLSQYVVLYEYILGTLGIRLDLDAESTVVVYGDTRLSTERHLRRFEGESVHCVVALDDTASVKAIQLIKLNETEQLYSNLYGDANPLLCTANYTKSDTDSSVSMLTQAIVTLRKYMSAANESISNLDLDIETFVKFADTSKTSSEQDSALDFEDVAKANPAKPVKSDTEFKISDNSKVNADCISVYYTEDGETGGTTVKIVSEIVKYVDGTVYIGRE